MTGMEVDMMRFVNSLALGAAVAFAFTLVVSAEAEAKKKASTPKNKACVGTTIDGKKVKFTCKASETCCFDGLMATKNCVPKGQVCF